MKKISLVLLIIVVSISFLLFHDKGNEYLKPYVASYLTSKLDNNMSVKVEHLKIDFEYVELHALLNELTKVKAQGEMLLLSKTLDLDYTLKSELVKGYYSKISKICLTEFDIDID